MHLLGNFFRGDSGRSNPPRLRPLGLITKQVYEMADAATKMALRRSYLYPANWKE